jgi:hypothetical protein
MSQALIDKSGRSWSLDLMLGTAIRIEKQSGYDLLSDTSFFDEKPTGLMVILPELERSPTKLAQVLLAACEPEIAARKLTPDQFLASWDGPSLKKAYSAVVEAVCDFFQDRGDEIRKLAQSLVEMRTKTTEAKLALQNAVPTMLQKVDVEAIVGQVLRQAEAELEILGKQSGTSPASSV